MTFLKLSPCSHCNNRFFYLHLELISLLIHWAYMFRNQRTYCLTAIALVVLFNYTDAYSYSDHRNRRIDSLEAVLQDKGTTWQEQLNANSELMWGYLQTNSDKSIYHCKEIIRMTQGITGEGLIARQEAFRILGQHAYAICLYDSAINCYERALETAGIAQKSGFYSQESMDDVYSSLYGAIGNLYNIQGMVTLAMDYYLKALPLFERNGWNESISTLYYNIGEMYLEMGNYEEAGRAYESSLEAALKTGDSLIICAPRYGAATVLLNEGKPGDALEQMHDVIEYYHAHAFEEKNGLMNAYVLLALIYSKGLDDMQQAQDYMDKALSIAIDSDSTPDLADAYYRQSELCLARREWAGAIDWSLRALGINDQDPHHNIGVYKTLTMAYSGLGHTDESARYLELMYNTMEEMASKQYQASLSEIRVRYETQKKEEQIALMLQQRRTYLWVAILLVIIVTAVFFTLWYISSLRRKSIAVESKLAGEKEERERLARDLHDRVGGLLTASRQSLKLQRREQALMLLDEASTELRTVAHHLMPDSLASLGLVTALRDYCQVLPTVSFTCIGKEIRLDKSTELLCYSIIHELINNALNHADASFIQVQLMFDDESFSAVIADNGQGFDLNEIHMGSGLRNIRERIKTVKGEFAITSTIGNGTEAILTIKHRKQ